MPKIYEYNGFSFLFYPNDHDPPHVHVKKAGKEIKVEIDVDRESGIKAVGKVAKFASGFNQSELRNISQFLEVYCGAIIEKWNIFFIKKQKPKFEKINQL